MPDLPLHPTLFFSLAILIGFSLSPLFAYLYKNEQRKQTISNPNQILIGMWIAAGAFAITIVNLILFTKDGTQEAIALSPLGMMIAALIASASVMKNIAETKKNETEKHKKEASKFHLDKCTEGLEHFYDLLKDGNNNRGKWIAAARALLTIIDLSKNITEEHHKQFFELEKSKYTHKLYDLYRNPINGHMINPLFFTGIKDWYRSDMTVSTIINSARNGDDYSYTYDDIDNFIDENSIVAVFSILDYPDDYLNYDPLSNPPNRYKEALKSSWTFFEPRKSAYEFIKTKHDKLQKDQQ